MEVEVVVEVVEVEAAGESTTAVRHSSWSPHARRDFDTSARPGRTSSVYGEPKIGIRLYLTSTE